MYGLAWTSVRAKRNERFSATAGYTLRSGAPSEGAVVGAVKRHFRLGWLLALAVCVGGLCVAHQAQVSFAPLSPQPPPVTAQASPTAAARRAESTPAPTSTWVPTLTPETRMIPTPQPVTLTVVYDNNAFDTRLKTAWGFACLVEMDETVVLFDTGGDGPTLLHNLAALGIDPRRIDKVVLSHYHNDHTGGLDALLGLDSHKVVYMPRSFPTDFEMRVSRRANVIKVGEPVTITSHLRTTGEMGAAIVEQSLIVETGEGLIVLTGCAHPGIVEIVRKAKDLGDVTMVMGGFHLRDKSAAQVEAIIAELKRLGVRQVAPSHCTGEGAVRQFKDAFGPDFIPIGAGAILTPGE